MISRHYSGISFVVYSSDFVQKVASGLQSARSLHRVRDVFSRQARTSRRRALILSLAFAFSPFPCIHAHHNCTIATHTLSSSRFVNSVFQHKHTHTHTHAQGPTQFRTLDFLFAKTTARGTYEGEKFPKTENTRKQRKEFSHLFRFDPTTVHSESSGVASTAGCTSSVVVSTPS